MIKLKFGTKVRIRRDDNYGTDQYENAIVDCLMVRVIFEGGRTEVVPIEDVKEPDKRWASKKR